MNKFIIYIGLISTLGCRVIQTSAPVSGKDDFEIKNGNFVGLTYSDTTYFSDGTIESIFIYAYDFEQIKTKMYVGRQIEYFDNGNKKFDGSYKIGSFVNCCFAGYCMMFYPYKSGQWKYYYNNGQVKAFGTYLNSLEHMDTSCEGGDDYYTNRISEDWKFYDTEGNLVEPSEKVIEELEAVNTFISYWL